MNYKAFFFWSFSHQGQKETIHAAYQNHYLQYPSPQISSSVNPWAPATPSTLPPPSPPHYSVAVRMQQPEALILLCQVQEPLEVKRIYRLISVRVLDSNIMWKMVAVCSSKMFASPYKTTWRYYPGDTHWLLHCCKNLKSQIIEITVWSQPRRTT